MEEGTEEEEDEQMVLYGRTWHVNGKRESGMERVQRVHNNTQDVTSNVCEYIRAYRMRREYVSAIHITRMTCALFRRRSVRPNRPND